MQFSWPHVLATLARIESRLIHLEQLSLREFTAIERHQAMADATLDDVLANTAAEKTEVDSLITLTSGIKTQLDQALAGEPISPAGVAKVNAIFAAINAHKQEISDAILANTPSATGTGTGIGGTAATSITVTSGTNPGTVGTPVVLTAVVVQTSAATPQAKSTATGAPSTIQNLPQSSIAAAPVSPSPTGTVQFLDGATVLGTGTLDSTGTTTFSATFAAPAGSHAITAVYSGDANNAGSTSSVLTQTVA